MEKNEKTIPFETEENKNVFLYKDSNGVLLLYTQFPRCYPGGLQEMIEQLPEINRMEFNAVWINPVQEVGKKIVRRQGGARVKGSLYAMYDDKHFNPVFGITEELLKQYTNQAKVLGLIPMFDLVLNQIAADDTSPLVVAFNSDLYYKKDRWGKIIWDDTKFFDYEDLAKREKIINNLWKPYIARYIKDYGFMGVRVDAIKHLHPGVQKIIYEYINECCEAAHGRKAIILGELLDTNPLNYIDKLKELGLTHINNSTFWANYSISARRQDKYAGGWNENDWLLKQLHELRKVTSTKQGELLGGTVGYTGNHDEMSLGAAIDELNHKGYNQENKDETWKMKEIIMGVALTSDSGWYALCGDEFGVRRLPPMVFDSYHEAYTFQQKWNSTIDLRSYIGGINHILSLMPKAQLTDWVQHIIVDEAPHLAIVIRHSENGTKNLVCVNLDSKIVLDLNPKFIKDVMEIKKIDMDACTIHMVDSAKTASFNPDNSVLNTWEFKTENLAHVSSNTNQDFTISNFKP